jgi:hypothetical protein
MRKWENERIHGKSEEWERKKRNTGKGEREIKRKKSKRIKAKERLGWRI